MSKNGVVPSIFGEPKSLQTFHKGKKSFQVEKSALNVKIHIFTFLQVEKFFS